MAQRGITRQEIDEALGNRHTEYPSQDFPDRLVILGGTNSGRRLKIVVLKDDQGYVITVADRDSEV